MKVGWGIGCWFHWKKKLWHFTAYFRRWRKSVKFLVNLRWLNFPQIAFFAACAAKGTPNLPPPKKIKQFDELCFLWEGERPVDPEVSKKCPIFVTLTLIPNIFFDVFWWVKAYHFLSKTFFGKANTWKTPIFKIKKKLVTKTTNCIPVSILVGKLDCMSVECMICFNNAYMILSS